MVAPPLHVHIVGVQFGSLAVCTLSGNVGSCYVAVKAPVQCLLYLPLYDQPAAVRLHGLSKAEQTSNCVPEAGAISSQVECVGPVGK